MRTQERRNWMKAALAALGAVGLGSLGLRAGEGEKSFSADFGPDWQAQKEYTLEVAEAMPAEKYDFKPTAEMRSFGQLLGHIGGSIYFFSASARGVAPPAEARPPEEATKEVMVSYLQGAFDYAAEGIAALTDERVHESVSLFGGRLSMPVWKLCHFMRDHCTHHRGYSLPYLRQNGIQPPRYRFAGRGPSPV